MKLIEALEIIHQHPRQELREFRVLLVCSFSPLHLQSFLQAFLLKAIPDRRIVVQTGLYGDFWSNLARLDKERLDAAILVLEWSDLDPRLGLRSLGSWAPSVLEDIVRTVRTRSTQFLQAAKHLAASVPLSFSFPTLPFPPVSYTPGWRASEVETSLTFEIATMSAQLSRLRNVGIVSPSRLGVLSPPANRLDVRAEIISGFPYRIPHACALADLLAKNIQPVPLRKGLISDLDDTLWSGILGEVGQGGVSWDLEHDSHMHGVYQKLLHSLEQSGVLVGIASKNDAKLVDQALGRSDILLSRTNVFPVEAHWGPKSESVARILEAWNIRADAVVFVDDSPMELAEVQSAHPAIECVLFPKEDPQAIEALLHRLRDLFGKYLLSAEDAIRRDSLRHAQEARENEPTQGEVSVDFLKQAEAELTLQFAKEPPDPRALELVNKTNQFNLNGRRIGEREWQDFLREPTSILMITSYKDKYGPLGKIAVLSGHLVEKKLTLPVWVMSCRAFSRRIEHRCLEELFKRYDLEEIVFDFCASPKNGPIREFLRNALGHEPAPGCRLSRKIFQDRKQETYHRVLELTNG
jgi:FkbH-like protein